MNIIMEPLAKESLHTSGDIPLNYDVTVIFTEEITKKYGVKFDYSHFPKF